ncbi:protein phosphatase [Antricoccus suffuscus]|uniref:Serine/threonine protein phosphatase PstP n=1 Tax=Antricoccus suffuscus TaxID=1629062 RepID=A0A2T1A2S4_9ACTN|nr:PP2C family serine/threonine-protein phosphatase [Antricoccus suffuscus]PRZ42787.1 protein phosphatase [Antricoccus suffuscus]
MTLYLRYAARSDRGLVRQNNQDSVYAGSRLLAVADGMGGHVGGEVASKIVIAAFEYLDEDVPAADMLEALRDATHSSTQHLREVVDERPELDGMGTTLTAMLFNGQRIALCHVGDSRAYLLRDGTLTQITHDDTFVQALIDEGRITEEEASVHPQRSVILRALNGADVEPDLSMREARPGDRYVLCSDGLSSFVSFETIHDGLAITDPEDAAERLIDLALRAGGPDNVTVIVADVLDDDESASVSDSPVVDGAAGNNQGQRELTGTTPAARAAIATNNDRAAPRDEDETPDDSDEEPKKRKGKRLLITLIVVILALIGLFFAGRAYIHSQYFVGVKGDNVVIYNGVNTTIGPVRLYSLQEDTKYRASDLNEVTRSDLTTGVDATSLKNAREIVGRLAKQLLPLCHTTPDPASPTPTNPTPTSPAPTSPAPGSDTASPPAEPSSPPADPSASGESGASQSSAPQTPGVTCRKER